MSTKKINLTNFSSVHELLVSLPKANERAIDKARKRQVSLTKPVGSLGRLEELAVFVAGWQATERPQANNAEALIFAGNHGVCKQGVNPFPQSVTKQMVDNFRNKGAAINQICEINGIRLKVIDIALEGVSLLRTKRNDFATILTSQGIDGLIITLTSMNQMPDLKIPGE